MVISDIGLEMMLQLPLKATSSDLPCSEGIDQLKLCSATTVVLAESTLAMRNILL